MNRRSVPICTFGNVQCLTMVVDMMIDISHITLGLAMIVMGMGLLTTGPEATRACITDRIKVSGYFLSRHLSISILHIV